MILQSFTIVVLLAGNILHTSSGTGGLNQTYAIVYCVKPNATFQCLADSGCQRCETLQYYLDNVDAVINNQDNVTLLFMSGSHTANIRGAVTIRVPVLSVKGNAKNTTVSIVCDCGTIWCCAFTIIDIKYVTIKNIIMIESFTIIFSNIQSLWLYEVVFLNTTISFGGIKKAAMKNCTFQGVESGIMLSSAENAIFDNIQFYDIIGLGFTILHGRGILLNNIIMHNSRLIMQNSTVVIGGNSQFINGIGNVATSFNNNITLSGNILFANNVDLDEGAFFLFASLLNIAAGANVSFINNSALSSGGGLYLDSTPFLLVAGARMTFINNSAYDKGGAIYIEPSLSTIPIVAVAVEKCFFHQLFCVNSEIYIFFANNLAGNGGDDIYGASLQECLSKHCNNVTIGSITSSVSSVSSDPQRVCICDTHGKPQCNNTNFINIHQEVYPGEYFTIPAVIVGWDFGTTVGMVYTHYYNTNSPSVSMVYGNHPSVQLVSNNKHCTNLNFSLFSNHTPSSVMMYINAIHNNMVLGGSYSRMGGGINCSEIDSELPLCFHTTPIFFNVTLLPCPLGFTLIDQRCDCYLRGELFDHCSIKNGTGFISWSTNIWVNVQSKGILFNKHCPINYCNVTGKPIDLLSDPVSECGYNRQGILCGGCKDNYSLGLGSSHCIHCPDSKNLALLVFFAAAGFLLVLFISASNFTVSQGMINGLIFYANIVWTYRSVMLQGNDHIHIFLNVFLAWLNLDFGIELCFCRGLNAFWKTWLQYVFPFYTAGLFIIGLRYSSKLSKLFGNRSVPTLATLLFLSYAKLLRTIITSLELAPLTSFPNHSVQIVWLVDGRLGYGQFPHILLLIAALIALLVLWVPYTVLLLLMQWLRRLPNELVSRWITRYKPLFDAHFAPLKDKHHYWFGMLLLVRGILLLISSLTANLNPAISLYLLLSIALLLLWYMNYRKLYKTKYVQITESAFMVNLVLLVSGIMYADSNKDKLVLMNISIAVAFVKFCGIILWNVLWSIPRCKGKRTDIVAETDEATKAQCIQVMEQSARDDEFRDSILSEDTPLLINMENSCTY